MAKAETIETDVWVKFPGGTQLGNIILLKMYLKSHNRVNVDYRGECQFPFDPSDPYDPSKIYKFDLLYSLISLKDVDFSNPENERLGEIYALGANAQFVLDEEKVILRAMYPQLLKDNRYSWRQRERLADDFLDFLIENGIDIAND